MATSSESPSTQARQRLREQLPTVDALSGQVLTPPLGMRDLLPPESRARRRVSEQLQRVFDAHGYELVTTPLFERVEVFERGLSLDPRDLVRFVEPDTGDIAALRPDMTPQIARVVSTRLTDLPAPWRVRYEGTVIRRRRGRARRERQIAQVGVELIGVAGVDADVEVILCCARAVEAAGLRDYRIELSEVGVGRAMLAGLVSDLPPAAVEALARKDETQLRVALAGVGANAEVVERVTALLHMHGGVEIIARAASLVAGSGAEAHLDSLRAVAERLQQCGLGDRLGIDLGEVRGAQYYTGVSFALYAAGPGEALASGGRYDDLLARYGRPQPATGAGIDVENLLSALDRAGHAWRQRDEVRVCVIGSDAASVGKLCDGLRAAQVAAAALPGFDLDGATRYAQAWGLDAVLVADLSRVVARRIGDGTEREWPVPPTKADLEALPSWVCAARKE
jgi:ATP phosphoribosyltransferase regulatory subunit